MDVISYLFKSHMQPFGSLSLVWPTNRQLSPKVRAFIDFFVGELAAMPDTFAAYGKDT